MRSSVSIDLPEIWKVSVQVLATLVKAAGGVGAARAGPLRGPGKPVGVHGGHNVQAGGGHDALSSRVTQLGHGQQVLGQVDQQLSTGGFIAVHVANQLDSRPEVVGLGPQGPGASSCRLFMPL